MQVLANAAEDAQTIIGTGLIDALSLLAGEGNTVEPLAQSMSEFSIYVADAIVGTALLIEKLKRDPRPWITERNNSQQFSIEP
jgi:hypothetical protein